MKDFERKVPGKEEEILEDTRIRVDTQGITKGLNFFLGDIYSTLAKFRSAKMDYDNFKINVFRETDDCDILNGHSDHGVMDFKLKKDVVFRVIVKANLSPHVLIEGEIYDFDQLCYMSYINNSHHIGNTEMQASDVIEQIFDALNQVDQEELKQKQRDESIEVTILELIDKLPLKETHKLNAKIQELLKDKI